MEEGFSAWESREAKKGLAAARRKAFTWKLKVQKLKLKNTIARRKNFNLEDYFESQISYFRNKRKKWQLQSFKEECLHLHHFPLVGHKVAGGGGLLGDCLQVT